jgi:hypothetical protein
MLQALLVTLTFLAMLVFNIVTMPIDILVRLLAVLSGDED